MFGRRSVFSILTALVLSSSAVTLAGAASAGGPTSVLLVAPGSGRTASLYVGSKEYEELGRLVGMSESRAGEQIKTEGMVSAAGVTITWLIHDAQVWRVDRVDLSAADGPTIATQESYDQGDIWSEPTFRHGSADGGALVTLLDRLGVGSGTSTRPVAEATVPNGPVSAPAASTRAGSERAGGWTWLLAGVLLGGLLTLTVVTLVRLVAGASRPRASRTSRTSSVVPPDSGGTVATVATDAEFELLDSRGAGPPRVHPG